MKRREFFGLGLAPLAVALPARAALQPATKPLSRVAQTGIFPNVPLISHWGQKVNFYDDLIYDKTVLFNFFMIDCLDGVCPTATANMRKVQDLLGGRMGRDIFFYSITL